MHESIAELTRMGYLVGFYPYGAGVMVYVHKYGDDSRTLYRCFLAEDLPRYLVELVASLKAGATIAPTYEPEPAKV